MAPDSRDSLSMLIIPFLPAKTLAVILEGMPKLKSPIEYTASPFIWPVFSPLTSIRIVPLFIDS